MKATPRKITLMWLAGIAILLVGCGTSSDDRIAILQAQAQQAQNVVASIDAVLPTLEGSIAKAKAVLSDPNLASDVKDKILAGLETAQADAERYKAVRDEVNATLTTLMEAIETIQASGEATVAQELELYGNIVKDGSKYVPPQYSGYVYLAGLLVTLIGGIFGGKKEQAAKDASLVAKSEIKVELAESETDDQQTVIDEIVRSVDALIKTLPAETLPVAKEALKSAQSPATRAAVMEVKQNG